MMSLRAGLKWAELKQTEAELRKDLRKLWGFDLELDLSEHSQPKP